MWEKEKESKKRNAQQWEKPWKKTFPLSTEGAVCAVLTVLSVTTYSNTLTAEYGEEYSVSSGRFLLTLSLSGITSLTGWVEEHRHY